MPAVPHTGEAHRPQEITRDHTSSSPEYFRMKFPTVYHITEKIESFQSA